jgi:Ca2+-binding RTX toxin-like protein
MIIPKVLGVGARPLGVLAAAALTVGMGTVAPSATSPAAALQNAGSAFVAANTLTITGTNAADRVDISADPTSAIVEFNTDPSTIRRFDLTSFNTINVNLGNGDDHFVQAPSSFADKALTVDGGNGNDTLESGTGDGPGLFIGGNGDDTIKSGDGNDVIFAGAGNDFVDGNHGNDIAFLGAGDDTFQWDPGDGSDTVDGGVDHDTMVFNGSGAAETMSLSASGNRAVFLRDAGSIRMDMDSIENFTLRALGAADNITINDLRGTDIKDANIDLSAAGGGGDGAADSVVVNGTNQSDHVNVTTLGGDVNVDGLKAATHIRGSEPALDHLQVNTLDGNDKVTVDPTVSTLIGANVDLGLGQH